MKTKKTKGENAQKDKEIFLINDYGDLKFSLFFSPKLTDGWYPYYCSLSILSPISPNFKTLYASNSSSIVSELTAQDLSELNRFMGEILQERNFSRRFSPGTKDFILDFNGREDIYQITATIDLFTQNPTKLESGSGDSQISLTFHCTLDQVKNFAAQLSEFDK